MLLKCSYSLIYRSVLIYLCSDEYVQLVVHVFSEYASEVNLMADSYSMTMLTHDVFIDFDLDTS